MKGISRSDEEVRVAGTVAADYSADATASDSYLQFFKQFKNYFSLTHSMSLKIKVNADN